MESDSDAPSDVLELEPLSYPVAQTPGGTWHVRGPPVVLDPANVAHIGTPSLEPSPQAGKVMPLAFPVVRTPGGSIRVNGPPIVMEHNVAQAWKPPATPELVVTPSSTPLSTQRRAVGRPRLRGLRRGALSLPLVNRCQSLPDESVIRYGEDSDTDAGSKSDSEDDVDDDDDGLARELENLATLRSAARALQDFVQEVPEELPEVVPEEIREIVGEECQGDIPLVPTFDWTEDFTSFGAVQSEYQRDPGPNFCSQDPVDIFLQIWDRPIMEEIVVQTNYYAQQTIFQLSEHNNISKNLETWQETTVEEMYRYFAVLMYMALAPRGSVKEFWTTGVLEMPGFRAMMSRNRFQMLSRFIHFVNDESIPHNATSYEKKVQKIMPLIQHCNNKFGSLYTPQQQLSLDESLLLWKGRLSWVQCIRSKAARFGIKTFELCEATTGYMLKCIIYAGKHSSQHEGPIHEFSAPTAKVVLSLMEGYLDVGHLLVMDNWYNQLLLTRYLKQRQTDVLGTLNRRRKDVPELIKAVNERQLQTGEKVSCHCGDIAVTSWKDVKLVTMISTYHSDEMVAGHRAGQDRETPVAVADYNKYMGGVDLKDQKLSMFLLERKRGLKWYIKVFRRLLNTSILNSYIMYCRNPMARVLSHREFRYVLAQGLVERFARSGNIVARVQLPAPGKVRLNKDLRHFPKCTAVKNGRKSQRKCVRCTAKKATSYVTVECTDCNVGLCLGECYAEYHTLANI